MGIRVQDLLDPGILLQKLELALLEKNQILAKVHNRRAIDIERVVEEFVAYGTRLRPYIADTELIVNRALDEDKVVLLEGAQGTLLDVDHGTYPFVTSSSPTAGGACAGSGVGPTRVTKVIGILKAYTTRVGSGPFPTELLDEQGDWLRTTGGEYGVTAGRNRRCGWFDAVIARYATRVNGVTDYFLTKLDVLSGLEKVPVCVAYEIDGERCDELPMMRGKKNPSDLGGRRGLGKRASRSGGPVYLALLPVANNRAAGRQHRHQEGGADHRHGEPRRGVGGHHDVLRAEPANGSADRGRCESSGVRARRVDLPSGPGPKAEGVARGRGHDPGALLDDVDVRPAGGQLAREVKLVSVSVLFRDVVELLELKVHEDFLSQGVAGRSARRPDDTPGSLG
jgi:hypothetical protein